MPQAFDQSTSPREGKEVSKLMEFLYTCVKLIQDESIVQELQNLIRQYELGKIDPLLNREYIKSVRREGPIRNYI
jgi:hypothetical protein